MRERGKEKREKKARALSLPPKICIVCHCKSCTSHGSQGNYRPWDNPRCRSRGKLLPRMRPGARKLQGSFLHRTCMPAECSNVPLPYLATEPEVAAAPTHIYTAQMKLHFPWLCANASTSTARDALPLNSQLESHTDPHRVHL